MQRNTIVLSAAVGLLTTTLLTGTETSKMGVGKMSMEDMLPTASDESPSRELQSKAGKHDWLVKHPTILKLLELQNAERARYGIPPLVLNTQMCLEAYRHAAWMGDTGYYQHSGLPYREIIFRGPLTPHSAVNGWIYSPAHHSIMLSGTEVGLGYVVRNGQTYWVGVFR